MLGCWDEKPTPTSQHPNIPTSQLLRVIPPNRLCPSVADLHRHLAPLRSGLYVIRGVEAEDVLRPELVLDVAVNPAELRGVLDVVRVAAGLSAEPAEFVADVDLCASNA